MVSDNSWLRLVLFTQQHFCCCVWVCEQLYMKKPTAETWRSSLLSLIFLQTTGETDDSTMGWSVHDGSSSLSSQRSSPRHKRDVDWKVSQLQTPITEASEGPTKATTGPQEQSRQQNKDNKISHPSNKDGKVSSRCEKCGEAVNSWKRLSVCGAVTNQDRYTHIHSLSHTSVCVSGCWHCSIAAG